MFFRLFSLFVLTQFFLNISLISGFPSTDKTNKCLNYCFNDGVCVSTGDTPQCYCLPEWQGERCDLVRKSNIRKESVPKENLRVGINLRNHPCSLAPPNMCLNGGQCQYEDKEYSCVCPYTHIGKRCETESPCNNFCKNGGVCTLSDEEDPQCECEGTGYSGLTCHKAVTTPAASTTPDPKCEAMENMCSPGTCYVKSDGALGCRCPPTHTGDFCETSVSNPLLPTAGPATMPGSVSGSVPSALGSTSAGANSVATVPSLSSFPSAVGVTCASKPCQNGRPCYTNGNSYFCDCGASFTGKNCEVSSG